MSVESTAKKLDEYRDLHMWMKDLDWKFLAQKLKVVFIVNNCPAHIDVPRLMSIDIIFLPPSTISVTQPMDQDVTRLLKAKYSAKVIPKYIKILDAMIMLVQACSTLPDMIIVNCFKKVGFQGNVNRIQPRTLMIHLQS